MSVFAEEIVARAHKHGHELEPGEFVLSLRCKSRKMDEWNMAAFDRGLLNKYELYQMSRPIAVVGTIEAVMRRLRGVKACGACGLTAKEGCSH